MERLAIIGVSQASGGAATLESWQAAYPDHRSVKDLGFDEAVVIATCNRLEAVVALPADRNCDAARRLLTPSDVPLQKRKAYTYRGEAALEHLARVASSLDSPNPGEDQIMRQVRDAFGAAREQATIGRHCEFAFTAALRAAKRVRREVRLAPVNVSLFSLALPLLRPRLAPGVSVVILGAGELGSLAARALHQAEPDLKLTVVNRDQERAAALAAEVGAGFLAFPDFLKTPVAANVLVCATSRGGLVDAALLQRLPELEAIVDLGMPRNVVPGAVSERGPDLIDIEGLGRLGQLRRESLGARLAEAEGIIADEMLHALDSWTDRQLAPAVRRLRQRYRETIGEGLPADEAERLAHRFAHVPVKGLRAIARRYGIEAAATFLEESELA